MANDTGSNYFIIPGGETSAPVTPTVPTEPVSPFEKYLIALENLQPPVSLLTSNDPSTPTFTPMAPPTAVRVSPPITPTEPVSPFEKFLVDLENIQPPVDLNYKEPAPTPVYSTPLINRPTGLPSFQFTQKPSLGPIPNVVYGYDIPVTVPEDPIVTVPEDPIVTVPEDPIVTVPENPTTPARVPVTPINRQPIVRPLVEPTTIPIATRKMIESLSPGYFKDINYDPDEILAAAMRSMGGRQARRSILNELR